jgi:hypothetical protein
MAEAETIKCQWCGQGNDPASERCVSPGCGRFDWNKQAEREKTEFHHLSSDTESLRSIDASLKTIKRIAIWFLVISILGLLLGLMAAAGAFR